MMEKDMDILIRKATTADLDLVTRIEATCFPPAEAAPREAFKERLDYYAGQFLIAFNGDTPIGFIDGFVTDYMCDNYEDEKRCKDLFKENVLFNHNTLPIGEFAIGTNTTAYVSANRYDIVYLLPILIVEKMGPHFALGDTCYSRSEDVAVFNPDGKEIISRDNEVSLLRKSEPDKAYYNCHTDITIPYDEIGRISVVDYSGKETSIIENGRFVLSGTDMLNEPFED